MDQPRPWTPPSQCPGEPIVDDAQRVFDTVTGPNLRVSDNLIQAAVIGGGGILGAILGAVWAWQSGNPAIAGILVGGFVAVVVSLFISGAVIGLIRLRHRPKKP